jgi:predicted metalloprotease with PDZ domain
VIDHGLLTIKADNLELKHIILEFEAQHSLMFTGLSDFMDNKITLSYTGSIMDIITKLLKLLKIQNYAYTFNREQLIEVTALPTSTTIINSLEPVTETTKKQNTNRLNSSTVLIQKVLPDSQGEMVQLEVNDYIIAYNGHKISNARRLIDYVKKYKVEESVSIVIVRDERILEFTLRGGLIGVQIVTIPMKFEILENYYRDLGI